MRDIETFEPKYYALRWEFNGNKPMNWNIYNNASFREEAISAVRKYDRAPSKFRKYRNNFARDGEDKFYHGWEAFVKEIDSLLMWQFWSRCEYEMAVTSFPPRKYDNGEVKDCTIDVYDQCKDNVEVIARDLLWQYRNWKRS